MLRSPLSRILAGSLLAITCLAPFGPAAAVEFGPLPLAFPSAIYSELAETEGLTGSIELDVESVPVAAPTLVRLTNVTVQASPSGATFALDPSVLSPGLGVVQASGAFLIPTLFLRVVDGATSFDLAVPNVEGTLFFDGNGDVVGLTASFQVESPTDGIVDVDIFAPEPAGTLLMVCALAALAIKKEMAR